jgi:hypothetical protein
MRIINGTIIMKKSFASLLMSPAGLSALGSKTAAIKTSFSVASFLCNVTLYFVQIKFLALIKCLLAFSKHVLSVHRFQLLSLSLFD